MYLQKSKRHSIFEDIHTTIIQNKKLYFSYTNLLWHDKICRKRFRLVFVKTLFPLFLLGT
ncbi:hypothetical protein KHM09_05840 [Leptospira borgpetersenii]|nr:hypothetical protein KHM09_05840 [Leptospira borgpetersenii]